MVERNIKKCLPKLGLSQYGCIRILFVEGIVSYFYILLTLLMVTSGCEKVIDVDLNESDPAVVIEGNLSSVDRRLEVKVSWSGSYFDASPPLKIDDAVVLLSSQPGLILEAERTGTGLYTLSDISLLHDQLYRLSVIVDGEEYSAVSRLPGKVSIDSLEYEYQPAQSFFDSGYRMSLYFVDPAGKENYYRVKMYRNNELVDDNNDIIVFDDSNMDGKSIRVRFRNSLYETGDTARIEMLSIDKNAYDYFTTLNELVNLNPGSPAPANPISNISNGALGYFSAWASSTAEVIILEPGNK